MAPSGSAKWWIRKHKALFAWSSGKDAAAALERLLAAGEVEVVGLLSTIREDDRRVSLHGVPETLVAAQAVELGLPWECVLVPSPCPNEVYESQMARALRPWRERGVTHVAFGDLFLEDIRKYREERLARWGMSALFPLWGESTHALVQEYRRKGIRARVCGIDRRKLSEEWLGRRLDDSFLGDLPAGVDPCGENGEFHTFVEDMPSFQTAVETETGAIHREGDYSFIELKSRSAISGGCGLSDRAAGGAE